MHLLECTHVGALETDRLCFSLGHEDTIRYHKLSGDRFCCTTLNALNVTSCLKVGLEISAISGPALTSNVPGRNVKF